MIDFVYLDVHPGTVVPPDLKISARVAAATHRVHLEMTSAFAAPVVADLQPDFAWDAHGYAKLAGDLLGTSPQKDPPTGPLPDELILLQDLTGPMLAHEDVALSSLLQSHPHWAAAHEDAALLLVALALRDHAGDYSDSRRMLCRATAHLALAEALRGKEAPTWAGIIADAGIRTLAGREVDALSRLDSLAKATECPAAAKMWIDALRLRAKDDWRIVTPEARSPLLLKIAYFQTLQDKLPSLAGIARFGPMVDFLPATDRGHALMANDLGPSVEAGNRFFASTLTTETEELGQVLEVEGLPLDQQKSLGRQLEDPMVEQLFSGPGGDLRVIGPDMFKDFSRQHLLLELMKNYEWLEDWLGLPDDAEKFRKKALVDFSGMRFLETTGLYDEHRSLSTPFEKQVNENHVTWRPWEIASGGVFGGFASNADKQIMDAFYADGLPFGTVYNVGLRRPALEAGVRAHPGLATQAKTPIELLDDYVRHAPHKAGSGFSTPIKLTDNGHDLKQTYPPPDELQALAPSSFQLFACGRALPDLITQSQPWWDYDLEALTRVYALRQIMDDATLDNFLQKYAALEPGVYFQIGVQLRKEGKVDAAAEADRKGFDQSYDQVAMSNQVGPLIDYYYDHGRNDEAQMVAKKAADVYSEQGLLSYSDLLEKLGRLPEAADCAQQIFARYQDHSRLDQLFAAHPKFFHDQNAARVQGLFPNGLVKVDIGYFKGLPHAGCKISGGGDVLDQSGLRDDDIIVALDSYRVESEAQYDYIRALKTDSHMEIIVWRNDRYRIAHTSAPNRDLKVSLDTLRQIQH